MTRQILAFSRRPGESEDWHVVDPRAVIREALRFVESSTSANMRLDTEIADDPGGILSTPGELRQRKRTYDAT